jgi:nicotinate-nucleotide adenylyltransferase
MKIGILGGTFDPPHNGHLALGHTALEQLGLDEVMYLPAFRNPLKKLKQTPARVRLDMVQLAIRDEPKFSVSDIDIMRGGPSYALDTVSELIHVQPAEYWFIMGSDSLKTISEWKQPEKLLKHCRLGVVLRSKQDKGQLLEPLPVYVPPAIDWIEMPPVEISSTELRQLLDRGRVTDPWIKPQVLQYIAKNHLYRS